MPLQMTKNVILAVYFIGIVTSQLLTGCQDGSLWHAEGDKWIRGGNFLVTCKDSQIKVLKCLTDSGTVIEVGTEEFIEHGVVYSCVDEEEEELEGSGEEGPAECTSEDDMIRDNFLICCIGKKLKGCVDDNGDSLKEGFFTLGKGLLKFCNIHKSGMRGRIENRGCFNGTSSDDVDDSSFHVKKYATWRVGNLEYRCGDSGIHVLKCIVDGKPLYVGSAWMDKNGRFNVCKG